MTITTAQVTFRHMPPSPAVEARVQDEAADLERYCGRSTSCHVIIQARHQHRRPQRRRYQVTIDLALPHKHIIVNHDPSLHAGRLDEVSVRMRKDVETHSDHRDIYVCIRDAFVAARRQLEDHACKVRGDVKLHKRKTRP